MKIAPASAPARPREFSSVRLPRMTTVDLTSSPDIPVGRLVPCPLDLPPQHRVLVPECQQLSILGQVPAESNQDSTAEYPANQQVDDLEQHPASQPSLPPGRR